MLLKPNSQNSKRHTDSSVCAAGFPQDLLKDVPTFASADKRSLYKTLRFMRLWQTRERFIDGSQRAWQSRIRFSSFFLHRNFSLLLFAVLLVAKVSRQVIR
eukprot:TRINITY_DN23095_c0_g1_i1.p2 TRINITY_DN23095_c0_g1~~TRINITY_DN23095_c0_g1_i1.p2  ORF type:complete len:101 (+),score=1.83 TRINITY_DN23095_c0_g1_i1:170-472(+)